MKHAVKYAVSAHEAERLIHEHPWRDLLFDMGRQRQRLNETADADADADADSDADSDGIYNFWIWLDAAAAIMDLDDIEVSIIHDGYDWEGTR